MPATRPKRNPRDTTRALAIVKRTHWVRDRLNGRVYRGLTVFAYDKLVGILTDIDARETKRDPHLRRKR